MTHHQPEKTGTQIYFTTKITIFYFQMPPVSIEMSVNISFGNITLNDIEV